MGIIIISRIVPNTAYQKGWVTLVKRNVTVMTKMFMLTYTVSQTLKQLVQQQLDKLTLHCHNKKYGTVNMFKYINIFSIFISNINNMNIAVAILTLPL